MTNKKKNTKTYTTRISIIKTQIVTTISEDVEK